MRKTKTEQLPEYTPPAIVIFSNNLLDSCFDLSVVGYSSINQELINQFTTYTQQAKDLGLEFLANILQELVDSFNLYRRIASLDNAMLITTLISKIRFCLDTIIATPSNNYDLTLYLSEENQTNLVENLLKQPLSNFNS